MALPPALTRVLRLGVAAGVLAVVAAHVGADPFRAALSHTTPTALVVAVAVTVAVTWCSARRWVIVARALGLPLEQRAAFGAYYRSQLLNVTLPGGVVGDVDRAWRHGSEVAARPSAARAVVWERSIGVVALVGVTTTLVLLEPSGRRGGAAAWGTAVLAAGTLVGGAAAVAWAVAARRPRGRALLGVLARDLRALRASRGLPAALALSVAGVTGHLLVLVASWRATGVAAPLSSAVPLLAGVLLASTLPTSVAGWGPREGAAAVLFGAAGLGAATGVTVAAVYGVLTTAAALPGALVLLGRGATLRQGVRT